MPRREAGAARSIRASLALTALACCALAPAAASAQDPVLEARGSVEQVQVTGAAPGAKVKLLRRGEKVARKTAGSLGGVVFRRVEPGGGYAVKQAGGPADPRLRVLTQRPKPPSTAVYDRTRR